MLNESVAPLVALMLVFFTGVSGMITRREDLLINEGPDDGERFED